jgi:hypothetical protein
MPVQVLDPSLHLPTRSAARAARRAALALLSASAAALAGTLVAVAPADARPAAPVDRPATRVTAAPAVPRGWPSAGNTGPSGRLRSIHGLTIRRDGTVLKNVHVSGQVRIEADHVTLRNVRITSRDYYGVLVYGRDAVVDHALVKGTPGETLAGIAAYEHGSVHVRRTEVRDAEDGVRLNDGSSLRGSFVHDLGGTSASHFDAVTADGMSGWRIVHNTILNEHNQTAAVWIGDSRYGPSSGILSRNYLAGGGFTLYSGRGSGAGLRVRDNHFSTRYNRLSGFFGIVYEWTGRGNEWSGNVWADGPRRGRSVHP